MSRNAIFITLVVSKGAMASCLPPQGTPCTAFQGLYVGGNIGYGEGGGNKKFNETTGLLLNKNDLGVRGIDGGVGTGYLHRLDAWALGLSFDANWTNSQGYHLHLDNREGITAQLNNSLQVYARAGYVFYEQLMPFIGLGWDNSAWALKSTHTGPLNVTNNDTTSHRQNALLWKAGIDFLTAQYLTLGVEYTGTLASPSNYTYPQEDCVDSWAPQYNKIALTAKIIPFATPSHTPLYKDNANSFKGLYLAGNIGYDNGIGTKEKFKGNIKDRLSIPNFRGVAGGVGLGYLHRLGAWVVGPGFDAIWSNASATRHNILKHKSNSPSLENSLQLYLRMGYILGGNIMPFAGLGWDNSQWQFALLSTIPVDATKVTHRQNSLLWKLGVDFLVIESMVAGFEYVGTTASPKTYGYPPNFAQESSYLSHSWRPQDNKFSATLKIFLGSL